MTIDWIHFTPLSAVTGGLLIGWSVALLILCHGCIAGVSRAPMLEREPDQGSYPPE